MDVSTFLFSIKLFEYSNTIAAKLILGAIQGVC